MNLTLNRSATLPVGFATAVVLSSVLPSMAASLALTVRHEPVAAVPAPTALAPVSPVSSRDTGVPDAATALRDLAEPEATPVPTF